MILPPSGLLTGETVDGRYLLGERIGRGGYGSVYVADEYVGDLQVRAVALKLMEVQGSTIEPVMREIRTSLDLHHAHVLRCFSAGRASVAGMDLVYLSMEIAECSLRDVLDADGPLGGDDCATLAHGLADALAYLHDRGLVHRDVKPENVLRVGGTWKLSDFGTVRAVQSATAGNIGTPGTSGYAPPEAYEDVVSSAWDVWSMGCTLAESASGALPFQGDTAQALMRRVLDFEPSIPDGLPSWLDTLVRTCLEKDRRKRPQASDFPGLIEGGSSAQTPKASTSVTSDPSLSEEAKRTLALAQQGDAVAQFQLGWMFDSGRGVARNEVEAVKWLRKSAEQGDANGQLYLGCMCDEGRGVTQNDVEAVRWYRKAAEQGHADAQNILGSMYKKGRGVSQNDVGAVKWYRKSAEQGHAGAQFNLGAMYYGGRGVAQNDVEAVKWYRKAAEQGNANAQSALRELKKNSSAEAKQAAEAKQTLEEAMASMDKAVAGDSGQSLAKGARIRARVIQVDKDQVFVDLGTKAEGIVPLSELSEVPVNSTEGHVEIGQEFDVIVLQSRNTEGNPVVSKRRADFEQKWAKIVERFESGDVFEATVFERVKGGLLVDLGVRGFVPASHVAQSKTENLDKFLGEVLPFKIIEVDHASMKVVLSHTMAIEDLKKARKKEVFASIKVGDVVEGVVQRLTDYGAFVDIGGVDGLLHVSEISWVRLEHPREELKEGETIQVEVLKVDEEGGKISLGRRGILPDPWNAVAANYTSGEKIKVNVRRFVPKGVFVRLPEGVEAFMPVSEIANPTPNAPEDVLNVGDEVEPFIQELDPKRRKMVLSLLGPRRANFDEGPGVAQQVEAVNTHRKSAEQGKAYAQHILGWMYTKGWGVSKNYAEAVKWYRKAAEQGNAFAQNSLGEMHYWGRGVSKNYAEAVKWYRMAAEQGNALAQNSLGEMYYWGRGVDQNDVEAVKWYRKAAQQGNELAQKSLGHMYDWGQGVSQDKVEAVKWYRKSAEQKVAGKQGDASALFNLAWNYEFGIGVPQDDAKAVKWYRLAADKGHALAQNMLGRFYEEGRGVPQSDAEAAKWYRLEAEQGDAYAQYKLGLMYEKGWGVPQDDAEAVAWYRKAADQGDAYAQNNLGFMIEHGLGVAKNQRIAIKWYRKAAEQGNADAIEALKNF